MVTDKSDVGYTRAFFLGNGRKMVKRLCENSCVDMMEVGFSFEIREKIEFKYNGNDDDNVEGHEITLFHFMNSSRGTSDTIKMFFFTLSTS